MDKDSEYLSFPIFILTKTINQKSYIWPTLLHGLTVFKMTKWIAAVLVIIMSHY